VRIGVFGGSFDPVHIGHLIAAECVRERLDLHQVRFVPAGRQPFKPQGHVATGDQRVRMLELAVAGNPAFVVDRREVERAGPSYSVDTLRALGAELPDTELFLIMGADAARDLAAWHEAAALPTLARIVVMTRPGTRRRKNRMIASLVPVPGIDVSATQIREAVARGSSIRYLVPRDVEDFIRIHGLYRTQR
jgi:nicotinate-nucleotide adenylyltransferase